MQRARWRWTLVGALVAAGAAGAVEDPSVPPLLPMGTPGAAAEPATAPELAPDAGAMAPPVASAGGAMQPSWSVAGGSSVVSYSEGIPALAGGGFFSSGLASVSVAQPSVPWELLLERRVGEATWLVLRAAVSSSTGSATQAAPSFGSSLTKSTTSALSLGGSVGARQVLNPGGVVEVSLLGLLGGASSSSDVSGTLTTVSTGIATEQRLTTSASGVTWGGVLGVVAQHAFTKVLSVRLDLRVLSVTSTKTSARTSLDGAPPTESSTDTLRGGLDLSPGMHLVVSW